MNPAAANAALERTQTSATTPAALPAAVAARAATVQATGSSPRVSAPNPETPEDQAARAAAATGQPSAAPQAAPEEPMPKIKIRRDATTLEALTAMTAAMSDPTVSKEAVARLYDLHEKIFDFQRQATTVWVKQA